ncbi:hypothetical protein SCUCBS95973_007791 [Sporothrix curviconia]|uniref:Arm-like repeat domain-containing protein n=1 Tax=Sporothrix curviconia TaxID=1260050 RepID=A0ABP0CJ36_9PEZI
MVGVFGKDKKPGHVSDAAELAPVLSNDSYRELVWAFIAAIKNATSNSGIILPDLCEEFSRVLDRCLLARTSIDVSANGTDLRLGPVLQDLSDTLTRAVQQNELETQFQLVTTLANVLDAMNNIKTKGLSREFVHAPLLKELDKIGSGKSTEIRLIHAAKYAYQALLGVPSDESPINALLRLSGAVLSGTGKIAGSVSTMDPSKVLDGMAMLQDIPEMVSSMVGVVKSASESREAMSDGGRLELRRKPRQWYIALRYTDLMIRDGAFTKLTEFLQHVPCRGKVEFLGGVYAQLERAWVLAAKTDGKIGPELAHGSIVDVVDLLSTHNCSFGDRSLLDMWRTAVAMTIGLPHKAPPRDMASVI